MELRLPGGMKIVMNKFTGSVVSARSTVMTDFSVVGGGGYVGPYHGHANPIRVDVSSGEHREFWLKSNSGEERLFKLDRRELHFRETHVISVVSVAAINGKASAIDVAYMNHTTNTLSLFTNGDNLDGTALRPPVGVLRGRLAIFGFPTFIFYQLVFPHDRKDMSVISLTLWAAFCDLLFLAAATQLPFLLTLLLKYSGTIGVILRTDVQRQKDLEAGINQMLGSTP